MHFIRKLETFTNEFVCVVKLTTDSGQVGWGQTSPYNANITAQVFHRQVASLALGASALDIPARPCSRRTRYRHVGFARQAGRQARGRAAGRQAAAPARASYQFSERPD